MQVRHWYCPVAFPEEVPSDTDDDGVGLGDPSEAANQGVCAASHSAFTPALAPYAAKEGTEGGTEGGGGSGTLAATLATKRRGCPGPGPRVAERVSCADEAAVRGPLRDSASAEAWEALASKRWQPVSRRRVLSKGWHLDVGPGEFFKNDTNNDSL